MMKALLSSGERTELESIASQCPLIGGGGVLRARTLRALVDGKPYSYPDNCNDNLDVRQGAKSLSSTSEVSCTLYPNPTRGNVTLKFDGYSPNDQAQVELLTPTGGRVASYTVSAAITAEIDLRSFAAGVYLCKVVVNGAVSTHKLVVLQ